MRKSLFLIVALLLLLGGCVQGKKYEVRTSFKAHGNNGIGLAAVTKVIHNIQVAVVKALCPIPVTIERKVKISKQSGVKKTYRYSKRHQPDLRMKGKGSVTCGGK